MADDMIFKQENSLGKSFCSMHYSVWKMPSVGLLKYMFYYLIIWQFINSSKYHILLLLGKLELPHIV